MRFRSAFAALVLCLATRLDAQDLQYRMVTHMTMPSMPTAPNAPVMTMYAHGSSMRVDMDLQMPGMAANASRATTIVDLAAHKMIILQPSEKMYVEQTFPPPTGIDSTAAREMAAKMGKVKPTVRATNETKVIGGYSTKRYVITTEMDAPGPMPGLELKPNSKLLVVVEQWIADDAKLAAAYATLAKTMSSGQQNNPMTDLMKEAPPGLPLRSRMLMLQVPKAGSYDAEALLKAGEAAPDLIMAVTTEAEDIRTTPLDPALFTVPKDYTRRQ